MAGLVHPGNNIDRANTLADNNRQAWTSDTVTLGGNRIVVHWAGRPSADGGTLKSLRTRADGSPYTAVVGQDGGMYLINERGVRFSMRDGRIYSSEGTADSPGSIPTAREFNHATEVTRALIANPEYQTALAQGGIVRGISAVRPDERTAEQTPDAGPPRRVAPRTSELAPPLAPIAGLLLSPVTIARLAWSRFPNNRPQRVS